MDYPNHFARMWLLSGAAGDGPTTAMYAPDWARASTNIGIDVIAATAGRLVDMQVLAPLLLALSIALPPLGAVVLNRTLFGGWSPWQIGFAALGWSFSAITGFMNFQIGVGVALLAAACEPGLARRGPWVAAAGRFAFGALLIIWHPMDVVFYAALLGGFALGPRVELSTPAAFRASAFRVAPALAAALVPLALLYLLAPAIPGGEPDGMPRIGWSGEPLRSLWSAFMTYGPAFDAPIALALVAVVGLALARPRIQCHRGLLLAAGAIGIVAVGMPHKMADNFYMDHRLPIMALLTAVAAVRPEPFGRPRNAAMLGAALLALTLHRTAAVAWVWVQRQADVQAVERALGRVPPGSRVMPTLHFPSDAVVRTAPVGRFVSDGAAFWHLGALAVPRRQAFVANLFTAAGKQPLLVKPPFDAIDSPNGSIASFSALDRADADIPIRVDYLRGWRRRFDYVLVLNTDMPDEYPGGVFPELELVTDEGFARLYRIRKPPVASVP
jgi:hypothetical protein